MRGPSVFTRSNHNSVTAGRCARPPCTSVLRTLDGGGHWVGLPAPRAALTLVETASSATTGDVSRIRFADPSNGWAYGPGLWATHDGARSWHQVPPRAESSPWRPPPGRSISWPRPASRGRPAREPACCRAQPAPTASSSPSRARAQPAATTAHWRCTRQPASQRSASPPHLPAQAPRRRFRRPLTPVPGGRFPTRAASAGSWP